MKDIVKMVVFAGILTAYGCAVFSTSGTAQQRVYAIKSEYQLVLSAAVTYKNLPKCSAPGAPVVCSDDKVVAKLQQADSVAGPAIQAAENTVRDPNFDKSTTDAVMVAAQNALNVLTAVVAQLPKQGGK